MSLDVWLKLPGAQAGAAEPRIFIREGGQNREISRAEWDARYPGREPCTVSRDPNDTTVYEANVTHNLGKMAAAAGLYQCIWYPEDLGITHAHQLIVPLAKGLIALGLDPGYFKTFNPSNGWGNYEMFFTFVQEYLAACEQYPDATVRVSR